MYYCVMTNLTNFDLEYSSQKAIMVGENVVKLTEIAYIPLYASMYLLIPMKPPNKICTAVSEGSREYPHKLSGKKISTF